MCDNCEVWKYYPLIDGFRSISEKILKGRNFVVDGPKILLPDISFRRGFQIIVLSSLQLFSGTCY